MVPGGVRVAVAGGAAVQARALFLATGKHDLRGLPRGRGVQNGLIGLKMHLDPGPALRRSLAGVSELRLFPGGYAGLQSVEGGRANLCLLVRRERFHQLDRSWPRLLHDIARHTPHGAPLLAGIRPCWPRPLAIAGVPYGWLAPAPRGPVYRLGDQMAVIPSFAGDGIAIALRSAGMAAEAFLADAAGGEQGAVRYQRDAARRFAPVRLAALAARALEAEWMQAAALGMATRLPGLVGWAASRTRLGHGPVPSCG